MKIWYQSYLDSGSAGTYWEKLRAHLAAVADAGTQIDIHGISPPDSYAHPLMEWRCAREMICNAVRAEREGYDAFIVGHFQDAGLYEARAAVDLPVLGLGETSMLYACKLGQRLGLVTFKPDYMPWFHHQVTRYGLKERIAAVHPMPVDAASVAAAMRSDDDLQKLYRHFEVAVQPLLTAGADVLMVTGGGPMMLMSGLKQVGGAPLVDGTTVAVKMAEVAVKLKRLTGLSVSRTGEFAKAPPHVIEEFLAHPKGL
jgi:allantoin racemase